tara:strand:+ start:3549 stop:4466 length:918 start_codon:yes stop_codon:yes gene_type:complete
MKTLRTPDARFDALPGYPFAPNYCDITDADGTVLRMHYIDEGPASAAPVLCLHGEPTWSFLYRKMIPVLTGAGHRVLAPDLIGFGKSDKPTERSDYSYQRHVDWLSAWLLATDLRAITLVCQDWGGLLGLRLVADFPDRFARIVLANTALPTGDQPMGPAFAAWRDYSQSVPDFNAGRIVYGGTSRKITPAEVDAYNAPFPDDAFKAGARQFPMLVPASPDDPAAPANRAAWQVLKSLPTPVLTAFGADDKVMAGVDRVFQKLMPGAAGQAHTILPDAGHFLQEDVGPELAARVNAFIAATPASR